MTVLGGDRNGPKAPTKASGRLRIRRSKKVTKAAAPMIRPQKRHGFMEMVLERLALMG